MNSFVVCVEAVLPIIVLMAVGYLCQRLGVIKREAVPAMNRVAFTVFLSAMVFNSIYTSDIAASVDPFLLAYTAVAAVVVFGTRMFQNFAEIRRELLTSRQKSDKIRQDVVTPGEDTTK